MRDESIFYNRLDIIFDTLNNSKLKVDNELLIQYMEFSLKYLDKIENLVKIINKQGYLYVQIDDEIIKINIIKIFYESTSKFDKYIDQYKIIYENGLSEIITSIELCGIIEKGAVNRKKGIIAINKTNITNLIKQL